MIGMTKITGVEFLCDMFEAMGKEAPFSLEYLRNILEVFNMTREKSSEWVKDNLPEEDADLILLLRSGESKNLRREAYLNLISKGESPILFIPDVDGSPIYFCACCLRYQKDPFSFLASWPYCCSEAAKLYFDEPL